MKEMHLKILGAGLKGCYRGIKWGERVSLMTMRSVASVVD